MCAASLDDTHPRPLPSTIIPVLDTTPYVTSAPSGKRALLHHCAYQSRLGLRPAGAACWCWTSLSHICGTYYCDGRGRSCFETSRLHRGASKGAGTQESHPLQAVAWHRTILDDKTCLDLNNRAATRYTALTSNVCCLTCVGCRRVGVRRMQLDCSCRASLTRILHLVMMMLLAAGLPLFGRLCYYSMVLRCQNHSMQNPNCSCGVYTRLMGMGRP